MTEEPTLPLLKLTHDLIKVYHKHLQINPNIEELQQLGDFLEDVVGVGELRREPK